MATRYRRDKQKQQIEGQTIQWPQDTDEINRSNKSKVRQYNGHKIPTRSTEAIVASVYLFGILWPLYFLTFDLLLLFICSVSCGHYIVWLSICSFCLSRRYLVVIVLSDLRFVASVYLVCILWPLYCLTFDLSDEINRRNKSKVRHYNGLKILTRSTEATNRRSDNTKSTRYRRDKQKLQIEGQTIQWPQDTDEINRSNKSKVRQYNDHKIPTR
jgi:hypothetical protein